MLDANSVDHWYAVYRKQADRRFDSRHSVEFKRNWAWSMALIAEQHVSYYTDETEEA